MLQNNENWISAFSFVLTSTFSKRQNTYISNRHSPRNLSNRGKFRYWAVESQLRMSPGCHCWLYCPCTLSYSQVSATHLKIRHLYMKYTGAWSSMNCSDLTSRLGIMIEVLVMVIYPIVGNALLWWNILIQLMTFVLCHKMDWHGIGRNIKPTWNVVS